MSNRARLMHKLHAIILGLLIVVVNVAAQQKARVLVGPNVLVSSGDDGKYYELQVAADPTNPSNLLGSGILQRTKHPLGDQESRGFYSRDGGYSWNTIIYPEAAAFSGDPVVAYGRTGTGYFVTGGVKDSKQATLFYRSEDGGVTWDKPTYLTVIDREQIVVDHTNGRFAGNIYMNGMYEDLEATVTSEQKQNNRIGVYRSSDDGRTWIGLVDVANSYNMPGRRLNSTTPVLFTDGELLVPFLDFAANDEAKTIYAWYHYWFATSTDGGATFSSPQKFTLQGGGEIAGDVFPYLAIDNSDGPLRNRLYIVWAEQYYDPAFPFPQENQPAPRNVRILMSYSSDRGKSWAKPKMISAGTPDIGNQFLPTLAVNSEGTLAVAWYDTRDTLAGHDGVLVQQYLAASVDGGETFLPAVRVSSLPTDIAALGRNLFRVEITGTYGKFSGGLSAYRDYMGMTAASDGTFHPFWIDGRTGSHQIWTARVRVERPDKANTEKSKSVLVEADVSEQVEVWMEPLREFPPAGTVELPIRLKNVSGKPIYGPIKVEVTSLTGSVFNPVTGERNPLDGVLLNAINGKAGVGAVFDYAHALGDFESLPPGAISEGIVWRFKLPSKLMECPRFKFKVTARVEKAQSTDKPKQSNPR